MASREGENRNKKKNGGKREITHPTEAWVLLDGLGVLRRGKQRVKLGKGGKL